MKFRQILTTSLLIFSLGVLSGFSTILHSHDLDLHDDHEDCFSCEWNQVSIDQDPGCSALESYCFEQAHKLTISNPDYLALPSSFLSRAPPSNN
ncbi:MAG: hypothetical protein HN472_13485 [Nitrospina sp.]|mgnify:FL=1|nr:hypothetical protein [Nitrospina sp.]MBT3874499.1 hypothetical protein [Nitrospina sp.]MBT4049898.1 hypothetical protein [Nitrospina sp.]MBT4557836.1 hypothetical protein [Nitrospina sp.]MBT5347968.1 hypothetical protein [Nitrospina sp.]